jgi:peptide/nickel transport system substrate-binding protein
MPLVKTKTRRLKFWLHLSGAYFARYKLWVLTILLVVLFGTYGLNRLWPNITRANIITIGYVGNYTLETVPTEILSLATQSLISVSGTGEPEASLASHWTVSEDGKTYVVFLKDNLRWHDESVVDAKDITVAIENVKITALNNKAIEFSLPNPIASFPTALDKPVFKTNTFYGTGEFRITDIDRSGEIVQKISLTAKRKGLPRVDIKFYQREDQLQNAIKIGDVKYATVSNSKIFESWSNLEVQKQVENNEVVTIFFNTEDPLLSSKDLRQALSHAIDKSSFDGEAAFSPISPASWAYNAEVKRYDYNTGKAKELMSKSQVQNPHVVLSTIAGLEDIAESVKKDWEELGVSVEIKEAKTIPGNFQALLALDRIPADPDQYGFWHSTQTKTNITRYKDVKIDKLLEDARATTNQEARKALYNDFQKFLMEDSPMALLYHPNKYKVMYKNLKPLIQKLPGNSLN